MWRLGSGRSCSAACALFLLHTLAGSRVSALRHLGKLLQEPRAGRSYILHKPCPSTEGIGSSLKFLKPIIEVAQRMNLTYVCQARDFKSHGHHTGHLGYLWGCHNDSYVVGDMAAYDDVRANAKLTQVNVRIASPDEVHPLFFDPSIVMSNKVEDGLAANAIPVEPGTLYYVDQPGLLYFSWGVAYKWFRSQYHLVRELDEDRRNWHCGARSLGQERGRKRIVLQIRRGDSLAKTSTDLFVQMLDKVFAGEIPGVSIAEGKAHIVVISEAPESCPDFDVFRNYEKSEVTYMLGEPELEETRARSRFIGDLDCMTSADLLLLSRGGFSSLAAALQKDAGISLTVDISREYRPDVPSVRVVEVVDPRSRKRRREKEKREKEKEAQRRAKKEQEESRKKKSKEMKEQTESRKKKSKEDRSIESSLSRYNSSLGLRGPILLDTHYDGLPNAFVVDLSEAPQQLY